jgi:N-acetylmuramic acid 6-phosphate etherase
MSTNTDLLSDAVPQGSERRALLDTERVSPRYADIDRWEPGDILEAMVEGQFVAVAAVRAAQPALERAALAMETRLKRRGRLIYAGAGTSGRLVAQDGAELIPTFGWPHERLLLLIAGGQDALARSAEGAEDDVETAAALVRDHRLGADDALVAVAASGVTPFTLAVLREARRRGALTVGIANNSGTPLLAEADCPVLLETGPEPIAGSTRMKAGTSQRVALSLLSTLLMIRLGRVHGGLMVDMHIANDKLARRSEGMLRHLSNASGDDARRCLSLASGNVKIAALLLRGCDLDEAQALLAQAGGHLRAALAAFDGRGGSGSGPRQRAVGGR